MDFLARCRDQSQTACPSHHVWSGITGALVRASRQKVQGFHISYLHRGAPESEFFEPSQKRTRSWNRHLLHPPSIRSLKATVSRVRPCMTHRVTMLVQ